MTENIALVVDDTPANRDFLERLLAQAKFSVRGAESGAAALAALKEDEQLALAMVDMQLPDMNGLQLTSELRQRFPDAVIVIATMYDERSLMERAFQRGCNVFLVKPHGFMELFKRLTTTKLEDLRQQQALVIDQYGPRVYSTSTRG
ncbi:MAG: response regulator [Chloroflexi bacterium]|nr:response regulator [Chloroflexota bacterium]